MDKKKVLTRVKIAVLVAIIGVAFVQYFGMPFMTDSGPEFSRESLGDTFGQNVAMPVSKNTVSLDSIKGPTAKPPVVAKNTDVKTKPAFVPAPDYKTVTAAVRLIEGALNPELEKQWVAQRLAVNAQRERTRYALLQLEEVKAQHQAAMMGSEMESGGVDDMEILGSNGSNRSHLIPIITVVSISGVHSAEDSGYEPTAMLSVSGKRFDVRVGSVFDGITVSSLTKEGCVELNNGTSLQSVCI
jgi:hypothetical protein